MKARLIQRSLHRVWLDIPAWGRFLLREGWPILVIFAASVLEMAHIATSTWHHFLIYDGDSLTLPMVRESLTNGEPFKWVFSSQIFLFPEAPLYALCSLVTTSIRASLALNAYVNIFLLYLSLRLLAGHIRTRKNVPLSPRFWGLVASLVFVACCLLERSANINNTSIATLYLFTTYYYGVITSALVTIWLSLLYLKKPTLRSRRTVWISICIVSICSLTQLSNPLFLLQFSAPYIAALVISALFRLTSSRSSLFLIALQGAGLGLGQLLRVPFAQFINASTSRYIRFDNIENSAQFFHDTLKLAWAAPASRVELAVVGILVAFSLIQCVQTLISKRRGAPRHEQAVVFLFTFMGGFAPLFLLVSMVATGTTTTRYLLSLIIFPLLGLISLRAYGVTWRMQRSILFIFYTICLATVVFGSLRVKDASKILSSSDSDEKCISDTFQGQPVNGVGSYWTSRQIDTYRGASRTRVLQITPSLTVYPQLNNLGAYENKAFNFILVEHVDNTPADITKNTIYLIGQPETIHHCPAYDIYEYQPGTASYEKLNVLLNTSLNSSLK